MVKVGIILLIIGSIIGLMFWLCKSAPYGYEDEKGFHLGEPPIDKK